MNLPIDHKATTAEPPKGFVSLAVTEIRHYTDHLFAFRTERPKSFRFRSGEFAMIGLPVDGKPLVRAYSIASPNWEEHLEFYSIKVPGGPLTSRLKDIAPGDNILMRPKPVGTLVLDALLPGKRLFLFSSGTGIAPFASLIRDPEVYEKFDEVYLLHSCRQVAELQYGQDLVRSVLKHELLGELTANRLHHLPSATREPFETTGRITHLIDNGKLSAFAGSPLAPETDRVMICGSMAMLKTLKDKCENLGFTEGSNAMPGQFVIEKAFVD